MTQLFEKARSMQAQLSAWRREFHQHPELGFHETRTAAQVADILEKLGWRVRRGVGRTGVVAELGSGAPVAAIRADMDALPIQEANPVEYASQEAGLMHACGHDSHTAMLLGVAALLKDEPHPGTLRLLFQPSEEVADEEGISGAPRMIHDGAMQDVEFIIAQHVDPHTPVGVIRIGEGPASGGVDSWFGTIIGKGGHGAKPEQTIDPFYLVAHVILALNAIVSRRLFPFDPAVVSIGSLNGGYTENVIPDRVRLTGTLRYTEPHVQQQIHAEMQRAFELARTLGGDYELKVEIGSPPMINHPKAADLIARVGADLLGEHNVLQLTRELGAEDFGSFSLMAPGAMFTLGTEIEGDRRDIHHPRFDIDERALPVGTAVLAETVLRFLRAE